MPFLWLRDASARWDEQGRQALDSVKDSIRDHKAPLSSKADEISLERHYVPIDTYEGRHLYERICPQP